MNIHAVMFPVHFVKSRGWKFSFIDDGFGESGWFAYYGDEREPELETSICRTKTEAAKEAMQTYPNSFN